MPTFTFAERKAWPGNLSEADAKEAVLASAQLDAELRDDIASALDTGRPILTHLNADTTWLLSLTYPSHTVPPPGRKRFNILIDPWLQGPQSDVASWFSTQWHSIESSVQDISEVEDMLAEVESLQLMPHHDGTARSEDKNPASATGSFIDAIVISHEFTDHCHEATLREVRTDVPVFATTKAAELIRSWKHFDQVFDVPVFASSTDWRQTSRSPLPDWLGISRLVTKSDALYYHSAIVVCAQKPGAGDEAESIIYTPHGVESASFATLSSAVPKVQTLAFLHGLHDISITLTKQLNLGAHNALKAQRMLNARYWCGTHDEVKRGGGLVAFMLRRRLHTLAEALQEEEKQRNVRKAFSEEGALVPSFFELKSGESLLLQ